ncbi:Dynactin subunit 1 [Frankliniella fusca]|uniref:Dynactin subunit 1 n=1 Tax=Frankliniella fusca TaxID=407009 RepID=A0AAE1H9L1_9NEOP|nr:Dynactin subunit 1 [Frankliniella fusca]
MAWRQPRVAVTEDEDDDFEEEEEEEEGEVPAVRNGTLPDQLQITVESSNSSSSPAGSTSAGPCQTFFNAHVLRRRSISDPGRLASVIGPLLGQDNDPGPGPGPGPGPQHGPVLPGPGPYRAHPSMTHSVDKIVDFLKFLN